MIDRSPSRSTHSVPKHHSSVGFDISSHPTEDELGKGAGVNEHPSSGQRQDQLHENGVATPANARAQLLSPSSEDLANGRTNGIHDRTEEKGVDRRRSRLIPDRSSRRVRRYTKFENPQTTWFCAGHLMTGGDSLLSVALAVVIMFGLTGVWLGTTGVWLWRHGSKYGFGNGGGLSVVIIFVSVYLVYR